MTDKKLTEEQVAARFENAVATLKKLPSVRAYGYVSSWPDMVYDVSEIEMMDRKPRRLRATRIEISEMEETCGWINHLKKA